MAPREKQRIDPQRLQIIRPDTSLHLYPRKKNCFNLFMMEREDSRCMLLEKGEQEVGADFGGMKRSQELENSGTIDPHCRTT